MRRGRRAAGAGGGAVGGGGRCSRPARSWASSRARAHGARTRPARQPKQPAPGCGRPQSPPLWRRSTCRYHAHERRTLSIPREWCTQQSARAPPFKYVCGVYRMGYVIIIIISQRAKRRESGEIAARARARGQPGCCAVCGTGSCAGRDGLCACCAGPGGLLHELSTLAHVRPSFLSCQLRKRAASRARHFSTNYLCLIGYAHTLLYLKTIIGSISYTEGQRACERSTRHRGGPQGRGRRWRLGASGAHIGGYAGRALTRRPRRSSSLQSLSRRFLGLQEQRLRQRWRGRRRGQEQTEQAS